MQFGFSFTCDAPKVLMTSTLPHLSYLKAYPFTKAYPPLVLSKPKLGFYVPFNSQALGFIVFSYCFCGVDVPPVCLHYELFGLVSLVALP